MEFVFYCIKIFGLLHQIKGGFTKQSELSEQSLQSEQSEIDVMPEIATTSPNYSKVSS